MTLTFNVKIYNAFSFIYNAKCNRLGACDGISKSCTVCNCKPTKYFDFKSRKILKTNKTAIKPNVIFEFGMFKSTFEPIFTKIGRGTDFLLRLFINYHCQIIITNTSLRSPERTMSPHRGGSRSITNWRIHRLIVGVASIFFVLLIYLYCRSGVEPPTDPLLPPMVRLPGSAPVRSFYAIRIIAWILYFPKS